MPVRLTTGAKQLARWTLEKHGELTPDLIRQEAGMCNFDARVMDLEILLNAFYRIGEEGVRALSNYDNEEA